MAIYNLSDIIENLKDEKENYEKKLQAWKNFKIVTKKDGNPFSVLSKNFEGASIGKYSIVEDSDHPYLTVNYQTDRTGYNSDHIQIFHFLDELPVSDERRKEYKPQFMRQTVTMTYDEIVTTVKDYIENLKSQIKDYERQISIAETTYSNYMNKVTEAKNELLKACGEEDSLYYLTLKCFNNEY